MVRRGADASLNVGGGVHEIYAADLAEFNELLGQNGLRVILMKEAAPEN